MQTQPHAAQRKTCGAPLAGRPRMETYTDDHRRLCYDTSRWQVYLHDSRHAATDQAERALQEPLATDEALASSKRKDAVADMAQAIGRELFGRLHGDPERLEEPDAPRWMNRVHELLDEMPEWEELRRSVAGDPDFSALATNSMLGAVAPRLADLIAEEKAKEEAEQQAQQQQGDGDGSGEGSGDQPGQQPGAGDQPSASDLMRAAMRGAAQRAAEQAAEGKQALQGLAPGLDGAPPKDEQASTDRFDLIRAVLADPRYQEIARRAGRLQRISGRAELRRSRDVYEEVVDVELGSDLSRLLPTELMNLLDDDLEMLAMARILDNSALQYRLEGHEPQGRGPVIFLRDISSSMEGRGHDWGAAVGVALVGQAHRERRPMISATFNHGVHQRRRLDATGLYALDEHAQPRQQVASGRLAAAAAAMAHAKDGCSGGTDFGEPLRFAFAAGIEEPRADFVLLTDGCASCDEQTLARLVAAKTTGLRVFGLCVNGGSMSAALAEICNELVDIDDTKNEADAARRVGGLLRGAR